MSPLPGSSTVPSGGDHLGSRAVVLGAGTAGLLVARVLSESYEAVVVVERDRLADEPAQRPGIPQGRHAHALLSGASETLNRLFPGMLDELVTAGATRLDEGDLSRACFRFGGHELKRSGRFRDPSPLGMHFATRPFLEGHLRRRVRTIPNVEILDGHDSAELKSTDRQRITGVRVVNRATGCSSELNAELVVDAMGRGARTPASLESLGYRRPAEDRLAVHLVYTSQLIRLPAGAVTEKAVLIGPIPDRPTLTALLACEHNTSMLTVGSLAGCEPPTDRAGLIAAASKCVPPSVLDALRSSEPLSEVCVYKFPSSVRRRYDKMRHFPMGLVVVGDALCSFNPIYGQGMSVAAFEAAALQECLRDGDADLGRRFFRATAKFVGNAWNMAVSADLALPQIDGRRSMSTRLMNRYIERVLAAAESDIVVAEQFIRVENLVDPPQSLLHPSFVRRIAAANRRRGSARRLG